MKSARKIIDVNSNINSLHMRHINYVILFFLLHSLTLYSQQIKTDSSYVPLRYLAINAGNASPQFGCWEYKLCRQQDVENLRNYIATWQPDIIMISEVYMSGQLKDNMFFGPILPPGYDGVCGKSICRHTGDTVAWDASDASHEHECVAWKTSRIELISGSEKSVYGRNDAYGQSNNCNYDFTAFRVNLLLEGQDIITAIAVHPNSTNVQCRMYEISNYWDQLAEGDKVIIGGDFNTDDDSELQVPSDYKINFSKGHYWDLTYFSNHYSAVYILYSKHLDHAFSNSGKPCTDCGNYYGTSDLQYGAALGGYNNHPRADAGSGMDHRQILVDMKIELIPTVIQKDSSEYFKIYPNPAGSSFTVSLPYTSQTGAQIEILNIYGKVVHQQKILSKQETININLSDGIYLLKLQDSNIIQTKKLIIVLAF